MGILKELLIVNTTSDHFDHCVYNASTDERGAGGRLASGFSRLSCEQKVQLLPNASRTMARRKQTVCSSSGWHFIWHKMAYQWLICTRRVSRVVNLVLRMLNFINQGIAEVWVYWFRCAEFKHLDDDVLLLVRVLSMWRRVLTRCVLRSSRVENCSRQSSHQSWMLEERSSGFNYSIKIIFIVVFDMTYNPVSMMNGTLCWSYHEWKTARRALTKAGCWKRDIIQLVIFGCFVV